MNKKVLQVGILNDPVHYYWDISILNNYDYLSYIQKAAFISCYIQNDFKEVENIWINTKYITFLKEI